MKYQLILQWPASSIKDYDSMVEIEDALVERPSKDHSVDGHDSGTGEVNMFIHTNDPRRAFSEVESILSERDLWADVRAAYREVAGSEYIILWPANLMECRVA